MASKLFVKYLIIGCSSVLLDYCITIVLYNYANVSLFISVTSGFMFALIFNFILNKIWTFNSDRKQKTHREIFLYCTLVVFNLGFSNVFAYSLNVFDIGPTISKPLASVAIACWNYFIYKKVIFV